MSVELSIIRQFVQDRESFLKYNKYLYNVPVLDNELKTLLKLIRSYYDKYEGDDHIEYEGLVSWYDYNYPLSSGRESFITLVTNVYKLSKENKVVMELMEQLMEKHYASKLVNLLLPVVEGTKYGVLLKVRHDLDEFETRMLNPPEEDLGIVPVDTSMDNMMEQVLDESGYKWILDGLQSRIGGIKGGTLGLLYAFVNAGKSSILSRQAGYICEQMHEEDEPEENNVCYCGNEEAIIRVAMRSMQGMLGLTQGEIRSDLEKADELRNKVGWSRLKMFDSILQTDQLKRILDQYGPKVLLLDQATKVRVSGVKSKDTDVLEHLFNWYRETAKAYDCALIGVAQGVGTAENQKWLRLSDIYNSRVGIQGELDYAVGIGMLADEKAKANLRYFNISKNKGPLHQFASVFIPETNQWRDQ